MVGRPLYHNHTRFAVFEATVSSAAVHNEQPGARLQKASRPLIYLRFQSCHCQRSQLSSVPYHEQRRLARPGRHRVPAALLRRRLPKVPLEVNVVLHQVDRPPVKIAQFTDNPYLWNLSNTFSANFACPSTSLA